MVKTLVIMGIPGSGKGKQSKLLSEKTGFKVVSTGEVLRDMVKGGTILGKKIEKIMNAGGLAPDWLARYIFERTLFELEEGEGIIFEGAGRYESEARLFAEICGWLERDFRIINIKVSESSIKERLLKRLAVEGRQDDNPLVLENRLKNFYEYTIPAIEYFRSIDKLIDIDGEPLPEEVQEDLWSKLSAS